MFEEEQMKIISMTNGLSSSSPPAPLEKSSCVMRLIMAVSWPGVHTYHYAVDLSPRLTTHCPLLPLLSTLARFFCGSICRQDTRRRCLFWASCIITLHNVLFGQYVYLATEQAETYLKTCVLVYHLTYICPSLLAPSGALIAIPT